jgi:pyruvate-ferredoxin/flavodoxin oxidoreductase
MLPTGSRKWLQYYPITPSSSMGEYADAWQRPGAQPVGDCASVMEMQSEGVLPELFTAHTNWSLTTTFTAPRVCC